MTLSAIVLLAEGFETIEALTPIDVLRRAGLSVQVLGITEQNIISAHGVPVQADAVLSGNEVTPDVIVLPGGMPGSANLGASELARQLTLSTFSAGKLCAAICAAPAKTFAQWGMLDNRRATCFPGCESDFPETTVFCEDRVVQDGNMITSRGAGTALEFSLAIVESLYDKGTADALADRMLARR